MEVKAQVAVETGKDFDNMVAQVMDMVSQTSSPMARISSSQATQG
jgi:hypothetical protein